MPSTYTTNLGLTKPATGELAGTWGSVANNSYDFLDQGIDGTVNVPMSSPSTTLRTDPGVASTGRNKVIVFTGNMSGEGTVTIYPPTAQKIYFVINSTGLGFGITFSQGSGGNFRLENGRSAIIYCNGAGATAKVTGVLADSQVNSLLVQANLIINGQVQWNNPAIFNQACTFQGVASFLAGVLVNGGLTVTGGLTVNIGSGLDQPYDMYYRSAGGPLARVANGTIGQTLTAGASGPVWTTVQSALNMTVAGATSTRIYYANGATLAQDANLTFTSTIGVGLGMAAIRALTIGRGLVAAIQLESNTAPPGPRGVLFTTNTVARWSLETSGEAESGSNAGSNFILRSYNDAASGGGFINFASYRSGRSTFGVYNGGYDAQLTVANMVGAGNIEIWANNAGTQVAAMDNSGALSITGLNWPGNPYLKVDSNKRLEIGVPIAAGHPLGTLHVGNATISTDVSCCIALEKSTFLGSLNADVARLLYHGTGFSIQFMIGASTYYCNMPFQTSGTGTWTFSVVPLF